MAFQSVDLIHPNQHEICIEQTQGQRNGQRVGFKVDLEVGYNEIM